jgi:PPP family 3-phenylpropionic acid transporter
MPYWRLSGFYFFYFATVGALIPYWGLYLQAIGFTAVQIGNLMALLLMSRIVAPYLWGWMADHHFRPMGVARLASFLTVVTFAGAYLGTTFWWLALVMLAFSFFWNASLPLLEAATMGHLGKDAGAYGRVRLWGSIGFIVTVSAVGPWLDRHGTVWLLAILLALLGGIALFSLTLPDAQALRRTQHPDPFLRVILRREVFVFLLACFLMQASHGPYYTFYSIYLNGLGYSKATIGLLWAFAVVCEIGVFLYTQRLFARVGVRRMLLASFGLAAVRWLLIGSFPHHMGVLVFAQTLHAASFGAFHASAMQLVHRFFTGTHAHRGQAVYSSVSFGAGGAVGSLYSGYTWSAWGPGLTFALAAGLAALAFMSARFGLRPRT